MPERCGGSGRIPDEDHIGSVVGSFPCPGCPDCRPCTLCEGEGDRADLHEDYANCPHCGGDGVERG